MKNFLKKHKSLLLGFLVVILGIFAITISFSLSSKAKGYADIKGLNNKKSQVILTGQKYSLDKKQEENHKASKENFSKAKEEDVKKEKEQEEQAKEEAAKELTQELSQKPKSEDNKDEQNNEAKKQILESLNIRKDKVESGNSDKKSNDRDKVTSDKNSDSKSNKVDVSSGGSGGSGDTGSKPVVSDHGKGIFDLIGDSLGDISNILKPDKKDDSKGEEEVEKPNKDGEEDSKEEGKATEDIEVDPNQDKTPQIFCSIKDGASLEGKKLGFKVKAIDYKGGWLSPFYYDVSLNGIHVYSSGTEQGETYYQVQEELEDNNVLVITVKDEEGNSATKTINFSTNRDSRGAYEGYCYATITLNQIGKGTLASSGKIDIYENETVAEVIIEFLDQLQASGVIDGYETLGSAINGFYLKRIYKQGIGEGIDIPLEYLAKIGSAGEGKKDSLGEKDMASGAGWKILVSGSEITRGASSVIINDHDDIEIYFTLTIDG